MLKEKYSPMYFLSALGAGGLSISFFMYINFLMPHKNFPMINFDFIYPVLLKGNLISALIAIALIGILFFAFLHLKLLFWNIKQYKAFKKTQAYNTLKSTNAEVTLMAMPLTFTMTINVLFILGAVFVPHLWDVVEYLFPLALLAMITTAYYALKIFSDYSSRIIISGGFNFDINNNFSQLIAVFAFTMIAVSFAAPGAMSNSIAINAIGIGLSLFFIILSVVLLIPKIIFAMKSILEKGISEEGSPSLWILIPILTLIGIALVRINMGIYHHFQHEIASTSHILTQTSMFTTTVIILSIQLIFGVIGYFAMKKLNYFNDYIDGEKKSVVSFALVCPGVAFMVFGFFFVNYGLTFSGIISKYSIIYFALLIPLAFIQYKTIVVFFKLKRKFSL